MHEQAETLQPERLAADDAATGCARLVLTPRLREDVLACYAAGQSRRDIAAALGIGQTTVLKIVREGGAEVRFPRLTVEQCAEIARLYRAGMSQVEIARQLNRNKGHVWHVLKRAGLVRHRGG